MMGFIKRALGLNEAPPVVSDVEEDALSREINQAVETNKDATSNLQNVAFRQISDTEIVRMTVQMALSRLDHRNQVR